MEGEKKSGYYGDDERSESSVDSLEILREEFLEYNDVSSMSTSPEQSPESKRVCDLLISKMVEEIERQRKEAIKEKRMEEYDKRMMEEKKKRQWEHFWKVNAATDTGKNKKKKNEGKWWK